MKTKNIFIFKEDPAWKLAFDLSIKIHKDEVNFPHNEDLDLGHDLRNAANSLSGKLAAYHAFEECRDRLEAFTVAFRFFYEINLLLDVALDQLQINDETYEDYRSNLAEIENLMSKTRNELLQLVAESPVLDEEFN